jgi:GNAT superfamily N-acetyltransferase
MKSFQIRPMAAGEADTCESIMRSLPDWFGIDKSIVQYRSDLDHLETFVVQVGGRVVGFLTIKLHNAHTAEIHVMAIAQEFHRRGVGRAMIQRTEELLRTRGIEYLEVKTLGPSKPDANYETTRAFYAAMGFRPVEENTLWGEANPCLIMIKHLECQDPEARFFKGSGR